MSKILGVIESIAYQKLVRGIESDKLRRVFQVRRNVLVE